MNTRNGFLGLGALILASLPSYGSAEAQTMRCVDARGNVSYQDANAPTAAGCRPSSLQASRDPREESRGATAGRSQDGPADQKQLCMRSITSSLSTPDTARFALRPSGQSMLVGYVEAQNRLGAYLRREVWCEFSASGTLQHAYVDYDPAILRENTASK